MSEGQEGQSQKVRGRNLVPQQLKQKELLVTRLRESQNDKHLSPLGEMWICCITEIWKLLKADIKVKDYRRRNETELEGLMIIGVIGTMLPKDQR